MKKILITGSSGYIGSHLCQSLNSDYEITGLDINPQQVTTPNFYTADISMPLSIPDEFDAVIHLAALVNVNQSEQIPIRYYITNLTGTMNVISRIKTKNFIFASTGAAEGCASAYGISKRAAEDVVREYCTQHRKQDFTIFRFYNVIGSTGFAPTNPDGLTHNLIRAKDTGEFTIFGTDYDTPDGSCIRDYVHVDEICQAIKLAIEKPSNNIQCLGHGRGYSVKQIVSMFERANDCNLNVKFGPRRQGDVPISVLKQTSQYMREMYTIDEMLKIK